MESEDRPNPDELLRAVSREEERGKKGRLKVFLGMAAGVGKTYAMLEDAHKLKRKGFQVVVGIVNTHGRKETAELLKGLEILPPKNLKYKGAIFEELDLEAILQQKPDFVLVDELAHTNIPGSRHVKRWQDVQELLDNGIDVATTVNVQHLESLKDVVETITGVIIRETVPDSMLESADFIEMVDLTPTELLLRLKEGKVYLGSQAEVAMVHFFQEDRLTALREMALRFAADKVDHDLRGMVSTVERRQEWKPRERLLVAVSHSPHSQKLIRTTRRFAFTLDAPWIALHVDTGGAFDEEEREMLAKNLTLARELGADVITTQDPDIAEAIQRIARQKQVTQIVVGRPPQRPFFGLFSKTSLLDRLADECKDIDVHVIRQSPLGTAAKTNKKKRKITLGFSYLATFGLVCAFTAVNLLLLPFVGYQVVGVLFLMGILLLSLVFRKGAVFFGAILYGLVWDYFFIPPIGTFTVGENEDRLLLGLYLLTAFVTGILTDRARIRKEMLIKREATSQALYEIVRQIATSPTFEEIVMGVKSRLEVILNGQVELCIKRMDNGLDMAMLQAKEQACASWVYANNKEAGWSTATLPSSKYLYIPLKGYREMVGVLAYRPFDERGISSEEKDFLFTAGHQLACYLERRFTEEVKRQLEQSEQIEKIYQQVYRRLKAD